MLRFHPRFLGQNSSTTLAVGYLDLTTPNLNLDEIFWQFMFRDAPLSQQATEKIKMIFSFANAGVKPWSEAYQDVLDTVLEDQSRQGLRLHKGFPLYWLSSSIGESDKEKALFHMLEAFVEDVLTHGHEALAE